MEMFRLAKLLLAVWDADDWYDMLFAAEQAERVDRKRGDFWDIPSAFD